MINTGTTVATFLMIFVLQHSQNRDATAIQAKLDELIRASEASNQLIRAEQLTEAEVEDLRCDQPQKVRVRKGSARTSPLDLYAPRGLFTEGGRAVRSGCDNKTSDRMTFRPLRGP